MKAVYIFALIVCVAIFVEATEAKTKNGKKSSSAESSEEATSTTTVAPRGSKIYLPEISNQSNPIFPQSALLQHVTETDGIQRPTTLQLPL